MINLLEIVKNILLIYLQVSASQCKSVQVSASQCKSVQVSASHA